MQAPVESNYEPYSFCTPKKIAWLSLRGSHRRARAKRPPLAHRGEFPAGVSGGIRLCGNCVLSFSSGKIHTYIVLEWLRWHFHAFRDCLIRGRWCECQWRNWRNRFVKCARNHTGCRGLDRLRFRRMSRTHAQPLPIWSASNRSVQHLRVGIDAADQSEGFSVDLDQCSCFRRKFVTPGAANSASCLQCANLQLYTS